MPCAPKIWNGSHRLILASKSEARRHLLASAGLPFEIDVADLDERALEQAFLDRGGAAEDLPGRLARAKALEVSSRHPGALCVGADQVLTLEGRIFHKPETVEAAAAQLSTLSGRTHRLTSAFAVVMDGREEYGAEENADITVRSLSDAQIDLYLRIVGDRALASVGAYQVEALGVHLIERIRGDHSTILGLPLLQLLSWLRRKGALEL